MYNTVKVAGAALFGALAMLQGACSPSSLVDVQPTSAVVDPSTVQTTSGALQLYYNASQLFTQLFDGGIFGRNVVVASGLFTDELMRVENGVQSTNQLGWDEHITEGTFALGLTNLYSEMHVPRVQAQQAREALRLYASTLPMALRGKMYAFEAYTVVYFAELYCSGIPLASVPLTGSPTPTRGFSTQEMLDRAIVLFDSAITVSADSARIMNLARVGKGRALLDLGRFADAAAAVQAVPPDFVFATDQGLVNPNGSVIYGGANWIGNLPQSVQVMDGEGSNGLTWSTDPRTAVTTTPSLSGSINISAKYSVTSGGTINPLSANPLTPVRLADWLEAQLIIAEADLAAGGSNWLTILNTLRSTCVGAASCAPLPGLTASALPPLSDPGTKTAREDLLFKERAMWLYLTGHRQGDLRRLAHVYKRDPRTLWPVGLYVNPGSPPLIRASRFNGTISYGTDVVAVPNPNEIKSNPLYTGCLDMNP